MARADLTYLLEQCGVPGSVARAYVVALEEGVTALDADSAGVLIEEGLAERAGGEVRLHPPEPLMRQWARRREADARAMLDLAAPLQALYRVTGEDSEPSVRFLHSVDAVRDEFQEVQRRARVRVRAMERGPYRPARARGLSAEQAAALAAGVEYSVIYAAEVVDAPGFRDEVLEAVRAGETARVLPDVPMKMVLADEELGMVVRLTPAGAVEGFVVEPSLLLDTLRGFFDTLWGLAIPIRVSDEEDGPEVEAQTILRGLAAGLTDEAIARELGVSERTVARRVARLQQTMATRSRFQLGFQTGRRGLV